jgi:superfamily II DNA/RNA helicase
MRESYVHRSGTARAGAKGISLTVLQEEEVLPTLKRTGNQIHRI